MPKNLNSVSKNLTLNIDILGSRGSHPARFYRLPGCCATQAYRPDQDGEYHAG